MATMLWNICMPLAEDTFTFYLNCKNTSFAEIIKSNKVHILYLGRAK